MVGSQLPFAECRTCLSHLISAVALLALSPFGLCQDLVASVMPSNKQEGLSDFQQEAFIVHASWCSSWLHIPPTLHPRPTPAPFPTPRLGLGGRWLIRFIRGWLGCLHSALCAFHLLGPASFFTMGTDGRSKATATKQGLPSSRWPLLCQPPLVKASDLPIPVSEQEGT